MTKKGHKRIQHNKRDTRKTRKTTKTITITLHKHKKDCNGMQNHILKTCKITVKTQKMTCMLHRGGGGRIYYNSMAS